MSGLVKGIILLVVILGIGAGLVFWKKNAVKAHCGLNCITKEEVEMLLADVAKTNPMVLKRFKDDPEMKKQQLDNLKELLAFASEAQKEGLANESPNKEELENIRNEVVAVSYDKEINKDKGPMPPFGFISEDQVKAFWGEGEQSAKSWFENFKDKIGLGKKDREIEFQKFLDSKIAIVKKDNPQMKEITDEQKTQAREFFAKIRMYVEEYDEKAYAGQLPKEFQTKVNLQTKLQQAQFLARLYSDKLADKGKATDEEIAKYLADHPELDPAAKRAKAEEVLNRAKAGEDFATLAKEFSTDPGSKDKGGLYENVRMGQMVKPFEEAAMSVQPGEIVPNLVETDFGFHIIKLESKNPAPATGNGAGDAAGGETYNARHILFSTGVKDPENPMSREMPIKQYAASKVEEEKQKKLLEDIVASNHVEVPEDFDVPEVSEEQIQESMKKQMQMQQGPIPGDDDAPPPAPAKKPEAKKPEAKKK